MVSILGGGLSDKANGDKCSVSLIKDDVAGD